MANLNLTIPDGVASRLFDAIAARHGYNAAVHGTKAAFAKKVVRDFLIAEVKGHEGSVAGAAAQRAAAAAVDSDISIT